MSTYRRSRRPRTRVNELLSGKRPDATGSGCESAEAAPFPRVPSLRTGLVNVTHGRDGLKWRGLGSNLSAAEPPGFILERNLLKEPQLDGEVNAEKGESPILFVIGVLKICDHLYYV